ncbi:MAG: lipopolysaccharide heptosyltransferase II [Candidatus Omnitrophica bacterium]|nr:lipopolysaccharide heptosyltransferase II [Candidatus Omnitrophota bacterium]
MKILFVTLSNIGDCILTLPVLDLLRVKHPQAKITCLVPNRPKEIFINNPVVDSVIIFDKHAKLREKIKLFFSLGKEGFDEVIDLRNSFFGAFLPAKKRSSPMRRIPKQIKHMKDRHLFWANLLSSSLKRKEALSLNISVSDKQFIHGILSENKINCAKLIALSPGARSHSKLWGKQNFSRLCTMFIQQGWEIVLVGDAADKFICSYIQKDCAGKILDLSGKTTIGQLAALLTSAQLLITNDSAVMHLASYLNIPVAAIFGPTDEVKYAPWSEKSVVIKKNIFCRPCEKAQCRFGTLACLTSINPEEVFSQVNLLLTNKSVFEKNDLQYQRILIVRTDRIGDVVLSTPVIKALRQRYPQAYISMMVAPYALEIIEGNPYLDEVIVYDKGGLHKSWLRSLKFASRLKKKKFDLAVILHPTNRVHLLTFLAGIPKRLGYNRKLGFLLNEKKEHKKQEGLKHEAEYNLELLKDLGITGRHTELYIPIKAESEKWVNDLFKSFGIRQSDKLLAINPGASCPSKLWPLERFAEVALKLARAHNLKILVLAGPKDMLLADKIALRQELKGKVINLAGRSSISQLASILKRCVLFISNDSGPVHIASAVGTPVISIFGRSQPGLSPKRWGPLGKRDRYLHKEVGCIQCLAHNCQKEFACLKAISVEDVVLAAESTLKCLC